MNRVATVALVLALALGGCGGESPDDGGPAVTTRTTGGADGNGEGKGNVPAAGGKVTEAVTIVPERHREDLSPLLLHVSKWPSGDALKAPEGVEDGRKEMLVDLARPLVRESLFPAEPEKALRLDPEGRLVLVLGDATSGPYGQVSIERSPEGIYAVALRWSWAEARKMSFEALVERLKSVSSEAVVATLDSPRSSGGPHPSIQAEDGFSATYILDREGVGAVHSHALLYGTERDLLAIYQQVPTNHEPPGD